MHPKSPTEVHTFQKDLNQKFNEQIMVELFNHWSYQAQLQQTIFKDAINCGHYNQSSSLCTEGHLKTWEGYGQG